MSNSTVRSCNRRDFLHHASALGTAGLLGLYHRSSEAEPPPETRGIRFVRDPSICFAPEYLAEELLRSEGFSQVEYVSEAGSDPDTNLLLSAGKADFALDTAPGMVVAVDAGSPLVMLAGIHGGCWEVFGNQSVRSFRDLKGKSVAITARGNAEHIFISSMLAYVGIDPRADVHWLEGKTEEATMKLFVEGRADAFLGFPPQPQQLRAQRIGRVIVNTARDRPWSEYFCCMLVARREFTAKYPVATKRALRAVLKAADICAQEPDRAARYIVDKGYGSRYPIALEVMKDIPYAVWRTFDPESTVRFHALRLHEVGMIKSTPKKIMAQGTDWRFLNELKKELKA
jgi:NitT/TauT family transport system substrate-binding protein